MVSRRAHIPCSTPGGCQGTHDKPVESVETYLPKKLPLVRQFDASIYTIKEIKEFNGFIAIKATYPDAPNFKGEKIMVYKCTMAQLMMQKSLDPHFTDSKTYIGPVARFKPNEDGWKDALEYIGLSQSS